MELTRSECILLINTFNKSIENAVKSGIPIGKEYYEDIDNIKKKLYDELTELNKKEGYSRWN